MHVGLKSLHHLVEVLQQVIAEYERVAGDIQQLDLRCIDDDLGGITRLDRNDA